MSLPAVWCIRIAFFGFGTGLEYILFLVPFFLDKDSNSIKAFLADLIYLISQVHVKLQELIYARSE